MKNGGYMTKEKRLDFLIAYLLKENKKYKGNAIPKETKDKQQLLRALLNIRQPFPIGDDFLKVQDEYLQDRLNERGIVKLEDLSPIEPNIYLWKGDITLVSTDGIVNAANSEMLGCFYPCHNCIDNAIHTYSGVQLRLKCAEIGTKGETGKAIITPAYNLPSKYVIHTVGPIIYGKLKEEDCLLLASCYKSCLELADKYSLKSLAFCCISTGEFCFPNDIAAEIAVKTVKDYLATTKSELKVIFNCFKDTDYEIYRKILE